MNARSLHLGLNAVDPKRYNGWDGALSACENDATDMAQIARSRGFRPTLLRTAQATRSSLSSWFNAAARTSQQGDRLLLTIASHGSQVRDRSRDEQDGLDEVFALYDGVLVDDELNSLFASLKKGVRVIVIADSCHSGSAVRRVSTIGPRNRAMPPGLAERVIDVRARSARNVPVTPACEVILLAACQDNQVALDGDRNGLFTATLRRVWADGRFTGSYLDALRAARRQMPASQVPNMLTLDPSARHIETTRLFT